MSDPYDGFRAFVAGRQAALSRTAFFLTGSTADAEDLLQDALVALATRWPRLRDGDPEAYARQVMLNRVRSRWRRRQVVDERPSERLPDRGVVPGRDPHLRDEMVAALRRLTPKQRAVLYLRFYEDLSTEDAAELLEVSVGTVKSQTHAALTRLRELAPELAAAYTIGAPS